MKVDFSKSGTETGYHGAPLGKGEDIKDGIVHVSSQGAASNIRQALRGTGFWGGAGQGGADNTVFTHVAQSGLPARVMKVTACIPSHAQGMAAIHKCTRGGFELAKTRPLASM